MTTRKTRFDDQMVIEKYNEYKGYLVSNSEMLYCLLYGVIAFVVLSVLFPFSAILCLICGGEVTSVEINASLLLYPFGYFFLICFTIIPILKAFFWKKQFENLEKARRQWNANEPLRSVLRGVLFFCLYIYSKNVWNSSAEIISFSSSLSATACNLSMCASIISCALLYAMSISLFTSAPTASSIVSPIFWSS